MNTGLLERLAQNHPGTRDKFIGVFACDILPKKPPRGFYIVNVDPISKPGSHWIAAEIRGKPNRNLYFDSYGLPPSNRHLRKFVGVNAVWNRKRVQHMLSTTCGQWCLYFILRRNEGWAMRKITKPFRTQTEKKQSIVNDHAINCKIENLFDIDEDVIDRKYVGQQIARQMSENIADVIENRIKSSKKSHVRKKSGGGALQDQHEQ